MKVYAIYSVTGEWEDTITSLVEAHTNYDVAKERLNALKLKEEERIKQCNYCQECPYNDNLCEIYEDGGGKEIIEAMNHRCPNTIGHHYIDANGYLKCLDYEEFGDSDSYYIEEIEVIEDR